MPKTRRDSLLDGLDSIEKDIGERHGKEGFRGTEATKRSSEVGESSKGGGEEEARSPDKNYSSKVLEPLREHYHEMDGGERGGRSAHLAEGDMAHGVEKGSDTSEVSGEVNEDAYTRSHAEEIKGDCPHCGGTGKRR